MTEAPRTETRAMPKLVAVGISVAALLLVFRKIDLHSLAHVLAQANPIWILAAGIIFGVGFLMAAVRWQLILRLSQCEVHSGTAPRIVLIGHLFNTVLFGPAGGDIAKAALYARAYGYPVPAVFSTCVLDRFLGGLGFLVIAMSTPGFAMNGGKWVQRGQALVSSSWFLIVVLGALVVLALAVLNRRRLWWPPPLRRVIGAVLANGTELLRHPGVAWRGLVLAILSHIFISGVFLFSLKAVTHTPFSVSSVFWVFPAISVISAAPVTVAGAGVREGSALLLLGLYGIPAADAVAASLLVLLIYLLWAGFGGFLLSRTALDCLKRPGVPGPVTISVVIPTLNEAEALPETVSRLKAVPEVTEIIVVDAGSTDTTVQKARQLDCHVLVGPRGRGSQLRAGAAQARGDVVLLLHADTWLPAGAGRALVNCLRDPGVVAGGFWKTFRERRLLMAGSRVRCALRLWLFRRLMGDQAMFVRRDALERIGGVPDVPLMEEFELCRRLRKLGRLALASGTVTTSARRFIQHGVSRTYFRMWRVTLQYYLGTPLQSLQRLYEDD
jgi:rSAM/selenodomain-associated transferase 2